MAEPITVAIVDDSSVVRVGLRALLSLDPNLTVVAEAADGDSALKEVAITRPDVVVLDVRMPGRDGLSVVKHMARHSRVVMLTFSDEPHIIRQALADGAIGYLVHGTFDAESLSHMVRSAAAGSGAFSGPALEVLRHGGGAVPLAAHRRQLGLSARQAEVMDLIAEGLSNGEISKRLFVAEKTVKNHINQIFAILQVSSRSEAMVRWLNPQSP